MPTVLLLDVSLSMSRTAPFAATQSPSSPAVEPVTLRQLAFTGINSFLDSLTASSKLEFVSLVIFSSLYEQLVPFTRDYSEVRNALAKIEEYNKTCLEIALRGVNSIVMDEWGTSVKCQVILITDGSISSIDRLLAEDQTPPLQLGYQLNVICLAPPGDPLLNASEPLYRRLIASAAPGGKLYFPDALPCERGIQQIFAAIWNDHYMPFNGFLRCGNLRCPISLFPSPENYDREHLSVRIQKTVAKEIDVCGFLDIRDVSNPPYLSRHLVLPLPSSSPTPAKCDGSAIDSDTADDVDKSAAFTVLLHGSLKVEQMVAIVQVGEEWYGMMYSFADTKKKSNLMLSIFRPGDDCLPWLGKMSQLAPAADFLSAPYGDDSSDTRSPFPVVPVDKRSYTQNCVVWIKNAGIQADIQKILRAAKRLPEKLQHFYKELNRLRNAALSLGFYELLDAIAQLLDRECAQLPIQAHADAALQMTHAARLLRDPSTARDASRPILPVRTNFAESN